MKKESWVKSCCLTSRQGHMPVSEPERFHDLLRSLVCATELKWSQLRVTCCFTVMFCIIWLSAWHQSTKLAAAGWPLSPPPGIFMEKERFISQGYSRDQCFENDINMWPFFLVNKEWCLLRKHKQFWKETLFSIFIFVYVSIILYCLYGHVFALSLGTEARIRSQTLWYLQC